MHNVNISDVCILPTQYKANIFIQAGFFNYKFFYVYIDMCITSRLKQTNLDLGSKKKID